MTIFGRNNLKQPVILALAGGFAITSAGCKRPAEEPADAAVTAPMVAVTASTTPPTVAPATASPSTAPALVDYQDKGVHFQYPQNWKPKTDKDYEFHLVPADGGGHSNITFDIPDLPPHFSWMIKLSRIENGYTDDLKKNHADVHVDSAEDHDVNDGAKARLVQSSWKAGGTTHNDVALLMMRKDQVYILTCDADAKDLPATRADFDKIAASLHWDK